MEFFNEKNLINIVYSVILGLIFGGIYDIIRIAYVMCGIASYRCDTPYFKKSGIAFFLFAVLDLITVLVFTAVYSFFDYYIENMRFRAYILLSAIVGFIIYRKTVCRLVMMLSEWLANIIKKIIVSFVIRPLVFVAHCIERVGLIICRYTIGRLIVSIGAVIAIHRTNNALRTLKRDISSER